MTELQREYELANRAEKRNQEMLRQKLLAKVRVLCARWMGWRCRPPSGSPDRCCRTARTHTLSHCRLPAHACAQNDAKAERAGAKAAKRVGRVKSGREEREEAAKKSAMEELKAARERKARGAEER